MCCPGPVATGSETTPRVVYGPTGRIVQNATGSSNRNDPARCVEMIANAAAHGVDEAWIAKHPVLGMGASGSWGPPGYQLLKAKDDALGTVLIWGGDGLITIHMQL